jgi:hypothetical protein
VSGVEERVLLEVLRGGRVGGASGLANLGQTAQFNVAPSNAATPTGGTARTTGRNGDGEGRISAESVIASADSLPVADILRGVLPQEAELLRLLLLVPEMQLKVVDAVGPDQLPSTVARELFTAVVLAREPNDEGVHPPFSLTALIQSLDPETAALAQAVLARRDPNPRELSEADLAYEIERLIIDLEERSLDERSEYVQSALAEAEQNGDRASVDELIRASQTMNDQRRSLHRRRDQTKLITARR